MVLNLFDVLPPLLSLKLLITPFATFIIFAHKTNLKVNFYDRHLEQNRFSNYAQKQTFLSTRPLYFADAFADHCLSDEFDENKF